MKRSYMLSIITGLIVIAYGAWMHLVAPGWYATATTGVVLLYAALFIKSLYEG